MTRSEYKLNRNLRKILAILVSHLTKIFTDFIHTYFVIRFKSKNPRVLRVSETIKILTVYIKLLVVFLVKN